MFITTCGAGVREVAESLKASGEYLKSHIIQALALETAEAYAELIHARIRAMWGFADPPEMTMLDHFPGALSRHAVLLWLPGLPGSGLPSDLVPPPRCGAHRRQLDRGLHDGARGQRLGAGLPSPGGQVLRDQARAGRLGGGGGLMIPRPDSAHGRPERARASLHHRRGEPPAHDRRRRAGAGLPGRRPLSPSAPAARSAESSCSSRRWKACRASWPTIRAR